MPYSTDHTIDPSVMTAPSTLHYEVEEPAASSVEQIDTGLILVIR